MTECVYKQEQLSSQKRRTRTFQKLLNINSNFLMNELIKYFQNGSSAVKIMLKKKLNGFSLVRCPRMLHGFQLFISNRTPIKLKFPVKRPHQILKNMKKFMQRLNRAFLGISTLEIKPNYDWSQVSIANQRIKVNTSSSHAQCINSSLYMRMKYTQFSIDPNHVLTSKL